MNKLSQLIVKLRYVILAVAFALLIPSAIGYFNTRVNYDILTYLPKDIETMQGQDILLDQFGTGAFVLYVAEGMEEKDVIQLQRKMNDVTIAAVKKAKHVGILNACLRIKMMFKDQAKFTIESEKGIGMSVIITIPADMITIAE